MGTILRLTACAGVLAAATVGLNWNYPGGLTEFGLDLCSLPGLRADLRQEAERRNQLQECDDLVLVRLEAKHALVTALTEKQMALGEAALRFRELGGMKPFASADLDHSAEIADACLQTIAYVQAELSYDPELAERVEMRLRAELDRALERGHSCSEGVDR